MHNPNAKRDRTTFAIGALSGGFGLYMCLVGFGLLPPPSRINGPVWLAIGIGVAFLCAGASVTVRGLLGMGDQQTVLPDNTPFVLRAVYWMSGVAASAALASIGTWVAFGYGDNRVSIAGPFTGPVGENVGRMAFVVGTILSWMMVIVLARHGMRKLFEKKSERRVQ